MWIDATIEDLRPGCRVRSVVSFKAANAYVWSQDVLVPAQQEGRFICVMPFRVAQVEIDYTPFGIEVVAAVGIRNVQVWQGEG